jgi:hypothetical protein
MSLETAHRLLEIGAQPLQFVGAQHCCAPVVKV